MDFASILAEKGIPMPPAREPFATDAAHVRIGGDLFPLAVPRPWFEQDGQDKATITDLRQSFADDGSGTVQALMLAARKSRESGKTVVVWTPHTQPGIPSGLRAGYTVFTVNGRLRMLQQVVCAPPRTVNAIVLPTDSSGFFITLPLRAVVPWNGEMDAPAASEESGVMPVSVAAKALPPTTEHDTGDRVSVPDAEVQSMPIPPSRRPRRTTTIVGMPAVKATPQQVHRPPRKRRAKKPV